MRNDFIIDLQNPILVTGSNGFIGSKVVETALSYGFRNIRCFVRPSSDLTSLNEVINSSHNNGIEMVQGNLLSHDDCKKAATGVSVILHLAAGIEKTFPGSFMNSVITTRNLLDAALQGRNLKRFVNVSSFAVYSTKKLKRGDVLDETCETEGRPEERHEAYCYGKVKQEELVREYGKKRNLPYVIVRPGAVVGPGRNAITGRVGIDTFGVFLHLGGSNRIPLTYVDNCAEAILLAGIKKGIDGEVFNVVDDGIPTSREFLKKYKKGVKKFRSIYIPNKLSYVLCYLWESYAKWSEGQLPPVFNRNRWAAEWKGLLYSNRKAKEILGSKPRIPLDEAMHRHFEYQRGTGA
jgi:nucleoside-diphosphate-sugar epimerase